MSAFQNLKKASALQWSEELVTALEQSGIIHQPNGLIWLIENPRLVEAFDHMHPTYAYETKKFSSKLSSIHPLWVGYRSFHENYVHQMGASPVATAFEGIVHDTREEKRKKATRLGLPYNDNSQVADLAAIWDHAKTFPAIHKDLDDLTDDHTLSKEEQHQAQINKRYSVSAEVVRFFDKTEQQKSDIEAHKNGDLTNEALVKQAHKAIKKSFVTHFPCAQANNQKLKKEYNKGLFYFMLKTNQMHAPKCVSKTPHVFHTANHYAL